MLPSRNRVVSFFSTLPVFLLVLIAIVFTETLFRTLLHPELHSPESNHLLIRLITALVAPLLIITFFLRTRHLATEIKKMELLRAKEDWEKEGSFHGSLHIARVTEEITPRKNNADKFFPICAACKHIRDSDNTWLPIEDYFLKKHEFRFTHTFCNDCRDKLYPEYGKLQAPQ